MGFCFFESLEASPGGGNGVWEVFIEPHYKRSAGTPEAKAPRHRGDFLSGLLGSLGLGGGAMSLKTAI